MDYCTADMNIPRPRGDKAATIRKMLEISFGCDAEGDIPSNKMGVSKLDEGDDLPRIDGLVTRSISGDSDSENSCDSAVSSLLNCDTLSATFISPSSVSSNSEVMQPEWVINLPDSLRGMFEDQKQRKIKREDVSCLITSPLREVVVQMHKREGAIIKYLY